MIESKKSMSVHAAAAAAIREELKAAYPAIKFRVTSRSFSMGNDVNVRWTDGPFAFEVEDIIGKYQQGSFDGMADIYNYDNRRDDIPQVKYVFAERELSLEKARVLAEELRESWDVDIELVEGGYRGWKVADDRYLEKIGKYSSEAINWLESRKADAARRAKLDTEQIAIPVPEPEPVAPAHEVEAAAPVDESRLGILDYLIMERNARLRREAFQVIRGGAA